MLICISLSLFPHFVEESEGKKNIFDLIIWFTVEMFDRWNFFNA